eukprot:GEMP01022692.1.p1 GENE.GEMP01022692.1~~GEMP01022692.1.p1  ORF type:complete len:235 (-),score=37.72 GEMP01022692.1:1662-2366(-)
MVPSGWRAARMVRAMAGTIHAATPSAITPMRALPSFSQNLAMAQLSRRFFQGHSLRRTRRISTAFDDFVGVQVGRTLYPVKNEDDMAWALNAKKQDLPELENALIELEFKTEEFRLIQTECVSMANMKASMLAYCSIVFFSVEFAMMTYGTYFLYSWDIMEPISYLLGLFDVICGYTFYAYYRTNYSADSLASSFRQSVLKKAYRKRQIDEVDIRQAEEELEHIRRRILALKSI